MPPIAESGMRHRLNTKKNLAETGLTGCKLKLFESVLFPACQDAHQT